MFGEVGLTKIPFQHNLLLYCIRRGRDLGHLACFPPPLLSMYVAFVNFKCPLKNTGPAGKLFQSLPAPIRPFRFLGYVYSWPYLSVLAPVRRLSYKYLQDDHIPSCVWFC